jgi:hypothetical protein
MAGTMPRKVSLVRVDIRRNDAGLLVATSPSLPSMLVIGRDGEELAEEIPAVIRMLYQAQRGMDVDVLQVESGGGAEEDPLENWAAVPAAVAASKLHP